MARSRFSPGHLLLLSFAFAISIGALLLLLPQARHTDVALTDIFFTATSATCVTGLSTIPLTNFTFFGKCVILALIQIGGLGLMTFSFFFASLFLNFGLATKQLASEILNFEFWGQVRPFILLIMGITFGCEIIGALVLYPHFLQIPGQESAVFSSFFHAVSAFCNAGISFFPASISDFAHNQAVLATISFLAFAGGIGFIVWHDLIKIIKSALRALKTGHRPQIIRISLHTKIVLASTVLFFLAGGLVIWCIEHNDLLASLPLLDQISNSLFLSSMARSTGFTTVNLQNASFATLFVVLPLMFIGSNPGSTGSGVKTTTFVIFLATIAAITQNRHSVEIGGRSIANDQIYKVMALVTLACFCIFISTFALLLSDQQFSFMQILFEVVSAFGTCGFSTGITPQLSVFGKCILMITMFIGRIGSLTLIFSLRKKPDKLLYKYPEERIMIG